MSERAFAALVSLFPRAFRERFGQDMRDLFRDQVNAARSRAGVAGVARLWLTVIPSLGRAIALEHRDAIREATRPRSKQHDQFTDDVPYTTRRDSVLETLANDVRFAGRMLRKSPVFTIVAVLVISLGSGAVATIFSAMNAIVLRPLPGTSGGGRLVLFDRRSPDFKQGVSGSYAFYSHIRDQSQTLDGAAAWSKWDPLESTCRHASLSIL